MKNTIKIATAVSAVVMSSTAFGVAGLDRLVFTPSILFEKGNYVELTWAQADPTVTTTFNSSANVAEKVETFNLGFKHQATDKFGIGLILNTQPVGVDINYQSIGSPLRGSVQAKSLIALGHYKITDRISAFGGLKHQEQKGNADLTPSGLPGALTLGKDTDTGFIVGGAYSIPKIALRASLSYESALDFSHKTTNSDPIGNVGYNAPLSAGGLGGGNTTSATPEALTLEFQSGIAKDTLLFGSIRYAKWSDAQVSLAGVRQLSDFDNTTMYKLGIGRKFNDSISGSIAFNYQASNGKPSSPFSPQDGERGVAIGAKYTAKNGFITSLGVQYRELGDTVTTATSGSLPFEDSKVVTVGLKLSKSF